MFLRPCVCFANFSNIQVGEDDITIIQQTENPSQQTTVSVFLNY